MKEHGKVNRSTKKEVDEAQRKTSFILLFFQWPNPLALGGESRGGTENFSGGHFTV